MFTLDRSDKFQARVADQLNRELIGWLTTVSPSGAPQPSPVWFLWDGAETLLIYSKPDAPKIRNITANSRVTFHFDSAARGEQISIFSGKAHVDQSKPDVARNAPYLEKYTADILIIGTTAEAMAADYTAPLIITIEKLRGY